MAIWVVVVLAPAAGKMAQSMLFGLNPYDALTLMLAALPFGCRDALGKLSAGTSRCSLGSNVRVGSGWFETIFPVLFAALVWAGPWVATGSSASEPVDRQRDQFRG